MSPANRRPSLSEVHRSIPIPKDSNFWRKMLAYAGPGYLVSVGYMDPGNWATDIAGGARFGYTLLTVILLSNLMAILLQSLCVRLGVATGRDLAQTCRDYFSPRLNLVLWVLCEIAIAACDLAELLGSAIALQLLFGLPLIWGVCITTLDVLVLLLLQSKGFRYVEALVIMLVATIGICFTAEIIFSRPDVGGDFVWLSAPAQDPCQPRDALSCYRHFGGNGDATQPIFALLHRANTGLGTHCRKTLGSH